MGHYKGRDNRNARRKRRIKNLRTKVCCVAQHVVVCGDNYGFSNDPDIAAGQQATRRAMVLNFRDVKKQVRRKLGLT